MTRSKGGIHRWPAPGRQEGRDPQAGATVELVSTETGVGQAFNHLDKADTFPWTLVEADVVKGRTLTPWPSLQTDLRNAGATWVDQEVHVDQGLVTSRKPDDLPAFNAEMIEEFAEGPHEGNKLSARFAKEGAKA